MRNIIIFGSEGTLGRAVKQKYQGENLFLVDRVTKDQATDQYFQLDVTKEEEYDQLQDYFQKTDIKLEVCIFCIGQYLPGTVSDLHFSEWQQTMTNNLDSLFLSTKFSLNHMEAVGRIVIVSSVFGTIGTYESIAYSSAKAATINFTKCLALDCIEKKIFVNCICPGFFESEILERAKKQIKNRTAWMHLNASLLKATVSLNDIVDTIDYLIKNESMTGASITIDGGYSVR